MALDFLLGARLLLVTGKGGTGKTTVAAALALLAAAKGRRTVLCEIDAQRPALAAVFGQEPPFKPVVVRPNLEACNLRWRDALAASIAKMVPAGRIVGRILAHSAVQRFLDVTPGSREFVVLSSVAELMESRDLVIADLPASGHAEALLGVLPSIGSLFEGGPVHERSRAVAATFAEPTAHLVYVSLPEEMVVNETLETHARLARLGVVGGTPQVVLNRATLPSLTAAEIALLDRASKEAWSPLQAEFLRAGQWEKRLEEATSVARHRLLPDFAGRLTPVPAVGAGVPARQIVGDVAAHLGRMVGVVRRDLAWS